MGSRAWKVAVVGALGMVGREMIKTLERRNFPVSELHPLDQEQFEGARVEFRGRSIAVRRADADAFKGVDIALFSAGAQASQVLAPEAVRRGTVVVDNSSAWRMAPECPLVIPEVNRQALGLHRGIIANPNCSTIQMLVVLKPLDLLSRIERIVVSTYQAASGAGTAGCEELRMQSRQALDGEKMTPKVFPYPLAFNVIPQIDVFQAYGYTKEEWKMVHETRKIMARESIRVTATCVRVPVFQGHSESVNMQTETPIDVEEAKEALKAAPGVIVLDAPEDLRYPTPYQVAQSDAVYVGRIRRDLSLENGLNLWIVADNVRKGAALNAVQIAEALSEQDLVRVP